MTCCLYRHFDNEGTLLYVGVSINLLTRLQAHKSFSLWFGLIKSIEIERYETRKDALAAELSAIKSEKPLYNIYGVEFKTPKNAISKQPKRYSKITKEELVKYFGIDEKEIAKKLKYKSQFTIKMMPEILTSKQLSNIKERMKKRRIKIPEHWRNYHYC